MGSLVSSATHAATSRGQLLSDRVDNALLDVALSLSRLTLEIDTSKVQQELSFFLDDLSLSNRGSEVLDEQVKDLLDRAIGEETLEFLGVQRLFDEVQGSFVDVALLPRVQHVQKQ